MGQCNTCSTGIIGMWPGRQKPHVLSFSSPKVRTLRTPPHPEVTMPLVRSLSSQAQLWLVALGYAAVFVVGATLLYGRHLQELYYPVEASGGMWAAGDLMLWIFIACLFLIPTVFLILVIARFEAFYAAYSRFLLGLSLSAPVCLSVFMLGENQVAQSLGFLCLYRLLGSPFILVGIGISRLAARFDRAKRLVSYALLIEGLTMGVAVALLIHAMGPNRR